MQVGLLFNGQGAQKAGMGVDLYENQPVFRQYIDRASEILDYDLLAVFQNEAELAQTRYAQPAIVAFDLALYQTLQAAGLPPVQAALGLSLGEYPALAASGLMTFDQAIALVKDRGAYMQAVGDQNPGKMVAVLDSQQDLIEATIQRLQEAGQAVYLANFNTFNQLVIGGVQDAVDQAVAALEAAGIKKQVALPVSGAFHTPLLQDAADQMAARFKGEHFTAGTFPVYSNTTKTVFNPANLTEVLTQQITHPTYFAQCLQAMQANGVDTWIEIGPAATLVKFAKKIVAKDNPKMTVTDANSLAETLAFLQEQKG
ncbi:ACP S-malonyltransferase [Leuconostocaceae bacterium ESL0958]|nr:ACP S-malonyltransferase [Leuconostocaceae bacterium ESL0958]